jgi:hypothetical protein
MTTATMIHVGDIFSYDNPDTEEMLLSEVIRVDADGTIVCAETLSTDARRTVAYVDDEVLACCTYVGSVRPSSDRLDHIEPGDLFVYTHDDGDRHGGNIFVLEVTHTAEPYDKASVFGEIHFPGAYVEIDGATPYRFERAHLADFAYLGKSDNGTRDGRVKASEKPTTGDTVVTSEATGPTTGTDASA